LEQKLFWKLSIARVKRGLPLKDLTPEEKRSGFGKLDGAYLQTPTKWHCATTADVLYLQILRGEQRRFSQLRPVAEKISGQ